MSCVMTIGTLLQHYILDVKQLVTMTFTCNDYNHHTTRTPAPQKNK